MKNHDYTIPTTLCFFVFFFCQLMAYSQPGSKETWDKTPVELNKNNTLLIILQGKSRLDKEFSSFVKKYYHGKIKIISQLELSQRIGGKKYEDLEKYRFALNYVIDDTYDDGSKKYYEPGEPKRLDLLNIPVNIFLELEDRKSGKKFYGKMFRNNRKKSFTKYLKIMEKNRNGG